LLAAALQLKNHEEIAFCFVGGGSEQAKVREFATMNALGNVKCLPYQPLSELSNSLSAADLHVVVMGDAFVGIVHPCKIYNILSIGAPVLYIGPAPSHVTDLNLASTRHGDVAGVTARILAARILAARSATRIFSNNCSKHTLLPEMIELLEAEPKSEPYSFVREVTLP
jgi:colanic acid biosynthesis glycosyl transferase WcaI